MQKILPVILMLLAAPAYAQTALCQQLATQIEREQITMAQEYLDAVNDNNGPRLTNKELRVANAWASISTSLTLMQANKCTPIAHPIAPNAYIKAGLACIKAAGTEQEKSACDTTRWKPEYAPAQ